MSVVWLAGVVSFGSLLESVVCILRRCIQEYRFRSAKSVLEALLEKGYGDLWKDGVLLAPFSTDPRLVRV